MKHFHMLMAFVTIGLFVYQSYLALGSKRHLGKGGKIATHVIYALLIGSGVLLVMPLLSVNAELQWAAAKIILLLAAVSASMKAFRDSATHAQSKMGIFIAAVAYAGILVLAFVKPANFL